MPKLLSEICHEVNKSETGVLSEAECWKYRKRNRIIRTQGGKEMPEIPQRREGKRDRIAKSFAHNLLERLLKYEDSVLRFTCDYSDTPTWIHPYRAQKLDLKIIYIKISIC